MKGLVKVRTGTIQAEHQMPHYGFVGFRQRKCVECYINLVCTCVTLAVCHTACNVKQG